MVAGPGQPHRQRPVPHRRIEEDLALRGSASSPTIATGAAAPSWTASITSTTSAGPAPTMRSRPIASASWRSRSRRQSCMPVVETDPVAEHGADAPPGGPTFHLLFNMSQEPFNDKRVREAFAYGFDRAAYCQEILVRLLHADALLYPAGRAGPHRDRRLRLRPRKGAASAGRVLLRRVGEPARDRLALRRGRSGGLRAAEWLAAQYRAVLGVELTLVPVTAEEYAALEARRPPGRNCFGGSGPRTIPTRRTGSASSGLAARRTAPPGRLLQPGVRRTDRPGRSRAGPGRAPGALRGGGAADDRRRAGGVPLQPDPAVLVKPHVVGYAVAPDGNWPGWYTPLTIDLAPAA